MTNENHFSPTPNLLTGMDDHLLTELVNHLLHKITACLVAAEMMPSKFPKFSEAHQCCDPAYMPEVSLSDPDAYHTTRVKLTRFFPCWIIDNPKTQCTVESINILSHHIGGL